MRYIFYFIFIGIISLFLFTNPVNAQDKHITVDTNAQMLYAWEGDQIVNSTPVSTGLSQTPTITGSYNIYSKIPVQRMTGYSLVNGNYDHPGVTDVMYFASGYAIHGAYWHNNFGNRMSNGCVNVPLGTAHWLYEWAPAGTKVEIF